MTTFRAGLIMAVASTPARAQDSITFDAVNGFVFIEDEQEGADARIEYLSAVEARTIMCLILDDSGQPIEIQRDIEYDGALDFDDGEAPAKDRILCQAQP